MRYFQQRAKCDYDMRRPNKKYLAMGYYLPSLGGTKMGKIAFAIDMSGSITQEMVNQACAEMEDVRQMLQPEEIIVLCFDTRVRRTLHFGPDDQIKVEAKSGGGTAFDDPVRVLEEMGETPEVLVYLTDLCSSCFPPEPEYPVLWVSTHRSEAPFGDVILVS